MRGEPGASATADLIRARGAISIVAPLSQAEAVEAPLPALPDRLIATSANALRLGRPLPKDWQALPIHCVGEKTAEAARAAGWTEIHVTGGDVSALIGEIAATAFDALAFAYLCGEPRRPCLEAFFAGTGRRLSLVPRYRIVRLPSLPSDLVAALDSAEIDAVLHFSAESARHFLGLARSAGKLASALQPMQACLSPAIGDAMRAAAGSAGSRLRTVFPTRPSTEALIDAALAALDRPQLD